MRNLSDLMIGIVVVKLTLKLSSFYLDSWMISALVYGFSVCVREVVLHLLEYLEDACLMVIAE